jgi:hypothetical protein
MFAMPRACLPRSFHPAGGGFPAAFGGLRAGGGPGPQNLSRGHPAYSRRLCSATPCPGGAPWPTRYSPFFAGSTKRAVEVVPYFPVGMVRALEQAGVEVLLANATLSRARHQDTARTRLHHQIPARGRCRHARRGRRDPLRGCGPVGRAEVRWPDAHVRTSQGSHRAYAAGAPVHRQRNHRGGRASGRAPPRRRLRSASRRRSHRHRYFSARQAHRLLGRHHPHRRARPRHAGGPPDVPHRARRAAAGLVHGPPRHGIPRRAAGRRAILPQCRL